VLGRYPFDTPAKNTKHLINGILIVTTFRFMKRVIITPAPLVAVTALAGMRWLVRAHGAGGGNHFR